MYIDHPKAVLPNDGEALWRYVDFAKFAWMLEQKALFFPRVSTFEDKYEGAFPDAQLPYKRTFGPLLGTPEGMPGEAEARHDKQMRDKAKMFRDRTFVSCWHLNEGESAAMWKIYSQHKEGIAIRTTFGDLKRCFTKNGPPVHAGKIRYLDHPKDISPTDDPLDTVLWKRRSFEHENELRVIYWDDYFSSAEWDSEKGQWKDGVTLKAGHRIEVDLDILIRRVHVAPTLPQWLRDLVKNLLTRYGLDKEVRRSELDKDPVF